MLLCCATGVLCVQAGGRPEAAPGGEVYPDGEVRCEEVAALQRLQLHPPGRPRAGTLTHLHTPVCDIWLDLFFLNWQKL